MKRYRLNKKRKDLYDKILYYAIAIAFASLFPGLLIICWATGTATW